MLLRDLVRDLYLFAATFRERLDRGQSPTVPALLQEVRSLIAVMDKKAKEDPALSARYDKLRFGLVGLIDEIIVTSTWTDAPSWPVLELELYKTTIAGDHVYDLISRLTPADVDLIEGYFYVLALGFRGKFAFDEAKWAETLLQLYRQLPNPPDNEGLQLAPEAYRVINRKAQRLDPLFSLARSLLVFFLCLFLLIVFYQLVWYNSVSQARTKANEVRSNLSNKELSLALEDASDE